jgi:hypothetical protein
LTEGKMSLSLHQKPGVRNRFVIIGESCKVLNADIDSNIQTGFRKRFSIDFANDAAVPAIRFSADGAGFGSSFQRSV